MLLHVPKADGRYKALRLPSEPHLGVQLINLLQAQSLSLVNHGPHEHEAEDAAPAPNEEDLALQIDALRRPIGIVDQVWRRVRDSPVQKPIRRGGHRQTLRANLEWEDLARHDPRDWTPRAREKEDVDADECDCGVLGGLVGLGCDCAGDGDDELAYGHSGSAEEEERSAAPCFDHPQPGKSGDDVDDGRDDGDDERVLKPGVGEVGRPVVEDEVDTCQLLQSLEETAGSETEKKAALEAVEIC